MLALERQAAVFDPDKPPEFNSRIAVLDPATGVTRFETAPRQAPSPLNPASVFEAMPRTAAFSPRAQHLVLDDTVRACPLMLVTPPAWLPAYAPSCPEMNTTLTLWDAGTGKLIRDVTYTTSRNPGAVGMYIELGKGEVASIALTDAGMAIRTVVATTPSQMEAISEQVALDQEDWLIRLACARLPSDFRTISQAAWTRSLPGEPYRAICGGKLAGSEN